MTLTEQIKQKAREIGFDAVGIAPAQPVEGEFLQLWLARGYQGAMDYMERTAQKRRDPRQVLPSARSIISVALNYLHPYELPYDQPDRAVISRYASGTDYHTILGEGLKELLSTICDLEPDVKAKVYVDTGPVMDKYWAARSGIGWVGKHTNLLSRRLGSWVFLGEILVDLELEYDTLAEDFCGTCTRCIDACPTAAIVEPYVLDGRRCISYLTIELREDIPVDLRQPMGNLVFGCDICQDVCPWNQDAPSSREERLAPREENRASSLKELAALSREDFQERFRKSPIKRAKWRGLMRNVAVAMGNSRDPEMVGALKRLAESGDELIREHALWALEQINPTVDSGSAERSRKDSF